jgi:hypothetical protein
MHEVLFGSRLIALMEQKLIRERVDFIADAWELDT